MASSDGTSSWSISTLKNSSSEEDLRQIMDQRKLKRKLCNRESVRRSRMRKQKHVDDLMGQLGQLSKENNQMLKSVNATTQLYLNIDGQNSVLRAQMAELTSRLQSLNGIVGFINTSNGFFEADHFEIHDQQVYDDSFINPWTSDLYVNRPTIVYADSIM
ncbi:bZIP_2 domain-containing protein [Cephalotus follicularis]|uniref:BZIP_2 domain-containing protein n=1 Tax=Cephalotus follicularis TaxID=3775 RepID=A0A1Q3BBC8_CEPFO|nr:bZIP_2 domain-containing protein [Cephalotus follicularis]